MNFRPVIASYSGDTYAKIRCFLNEEVLQVVARVAGSPIRHDDLPETILTELVEMHVLREHHGLVSLETSVFLESDIAGIIEAVTPLGEHVAQLAQQNADQLCDSPPEVANFLGGIIGIGQGLAAVLKEQGVVVDWKNYRGKYASSKVDFDEVCNAFETLGPDLQNKSVLRGVDYTAVFIGPGGPNFSSLSRSAGTTEADRLYTRSLNRYLVDAYASLLLGELHNEDLVRAAEAAKLFSNGSPATSVITDKTLQSYVDNIEVITQLTASYYTDRLPALISLLRSTTPGQQGVPPENMMLNLWRYIRKVTARELYSNGFLRDDVPQTGSLTVFYRNDAELLRRLLI